VAFSKKGQTPPAPGMHSAASSQPTLQQLLGVGAFSSPRQINGNSIPGWQPRRPGIDISTVPYCHRLLLRISTPQPSTPQHHMSSGTNASTTHQLHYHYHAPCSPAHPTEASRVPGQAPPVPYPYFPFFSRLLGIPTQRYLCHCYRTHKPNCNHYWPTPHPRRLPPSCLTPTCYLLITNHPQTTNYKLPGLHYTIHRCTNIHIIIRIIHYTRGPEVYILYNLSAALPPAQGAYCVSTQPQGVGDKKEKKTPWRGNDPGARERANCREMASDEEEQDVTKLSLG